MANGLTYSPSQIELGLQIARGPESITQASGLGNLGATGADIVGLETQRTIERMKTTPAEMLAQVKAPPASTREYSGIAFSPSTNKLFVGGMTFDREDVGSALQAQSLIGQPPQPAPANVATDWEPVSPQAYTQYIQNLKAPRGFGANVALGARGLAESTIGGVGDILTTFGSPRGAGISEFAETTFGQTKAEQERSALIQQSNSLTSNIFDAVAQGIPSAGFSLVSGGLGALGGAATAARLAGVAANIGRARTVGALTGLAASTYPSEFQSFYESAKNAKNPDGTPAYNIDDPRTRTDILVAAAGTTLLQTLADGVIARGFSPFFKDAVVNAGQRAARTRIGAIATGVAEGAASEAFAEGASQLAQQAVFDPEFRRLLNASDWKALAPYIIEKYGESALIAAGAGAVLGGAFGAVGGVAAPLKPTNLLEGAGKKEEPLALPAPRLALPAPEQPITAGAPAPILALPAPAPAPAPAPMAAPPEVIQMGGPYSGGKGLPLFDYPSGGLQVAPGEQIPLPLEGGVGVAPAPIAPVLPPQTQTQLGLQLEAPQPGLPLEGGAARLRRTQPAIGKQLQAQQTASLAALTARSEAAKAELYPVEPPTFAEPPTVDYLKQLRAFYAAEQRDRVRLQQGLKASAKRELANIIKAKDITKAEAKRLLSAHIESGKQLLKQLEGYIADPTSVPVVGVTPAPAPAPVAAPAPAPVAPAPVAPAPVAPAPVAPAPVAPAPVAPAPAPAAAPVQPTEVPNAAQVGQVQQGGQPQYTGTGGQVPSIGTTGNIPAQVQEGGGETGGGNIPVEGGPQPQEVTGKTVAIGDKVENTTFITPMNSNIANVFQTLWRSVGLKNTKVYFGIVNQESLDDLTYVGSSVINDNLRRGLMPYVEEFIKDKDANGYHVRYNNNEVIILVKKSLISDSQRLYEVMSHEIGHAVKFHALTSATDAELTAILSDYEKFLRKIIKMSDAQIADIMRITKTSARAGRDEFMLGITKTNLKPLFAAALEQAKTKGAAPRYIEVLKALRPMRGAELGIKRLLNAGAGAGTLKSTNAPDYWLGFDEWFADQTAKWATTQQKPLSLVEKFFKRLADKLVRLVSTGVQDNFLPAQSIVDFLNRMGPTNFVETTPTPPSDGGGGPQINSEVVVPLTDEENAVANSRIDDFINTNVPKALRPQAFSIAYNIRDLAIKGAYFMAFGRDLVSWISPMLPAARSYFDGVQKRNTLIEQLKREVDTILLKTTGLNPAVSEQVNKFLADSTLRQAWGYQPTWLKEQVKIDPVAQTQYNGLPVEAREIADSVFKKNYEDMRRMRAAIVEQIRAGLTGPEFDSLPEADKQRLRDEATARLRLMDSYLKERSGPYAALSRFGNYITVAKSKRLIALENTPVEERDSNYAEQLEALKANPDDYIVIFSDSFGAAKVKQQELRAEFPDMQTDAFEKQKFYGQMQAPQWMAMQQVRALIEKEMKDNPDFALGKKELEIVNSFIMDLYVGMLADNSARRHQIARIGTAGFDNMLRAFAVGGVANAHFIGSMNFEPEIAGALRQMSKEATSQQGPASREDRMRAFNEVMARHVNGIGTQPTPIQDTLLRYNSVWTLLTLPRYYILNASQTYMLSMPVMAAKFGYGKTSKAINDTYRDMAFSFAKATGGTGAALKQFFSGEFDLTKLKRPDGKSYSAEEIKFLETLRDTGLMDIGMGYDLGYWETNQTPGPNRNLQRALQKLTAATRQIEVINRVSSGLAAYRLARETMSAVDATAYASKLVSDTQGDYSGINAPRLFNAFSFSKLILQFRKYQLMQASLLIKNLHAAFAGASEEERKLGRAVLRNVLGQTALVTGALGLPLAGAVSYILAAIFGPPDEPVDEERFLRRAIGNDALADLILNGVPAGLGVDVSQYLGLNNVFSAAPYTDLDFKGRDAFAKSIVGLGGPLFGTAASFADGYKYMTEGQVDKGIEAMMPNGIKSAMRAYRETFDKGVTRRNGDLVMSSEEFNFFDTFLQTLGFQTSKMKDVKRQRQDVYEFDKYFSERTTQIRRDYSKAKQNDDSAGIVAARADWQALQLAKKRVGFTPSAMSNLLSAPKQQLRREQRYQEQLRNVARSVDMQEAED